MAKQDKRLIKSDTFFRMWHDSHNILLPPPQSVSNPLQAEIIPTNVQVSGTVKKSHFGPPLVEFVNTLAPQGKFDEFYLQLWRNAGDGNTIGELPVHNPNIDYHKDMGLNSIHANIDVEFSSFDEVTVYPGQYNKRTIFYYFSDNIWVTEILHFDLYYSPIRRLYGDFYFVCNPKINMLNEGVNLSTNGFLQDVNLPITAIISKATIQFGNSKMSLLLQNKEYPLRVDNFSINILGGSS